MEKEKIIKKYFNDSIKSKDLYRFQQETPQGNIVYGWISKSPGKFLSSMVLTKIETTNKTIECERFIRGMPKQHYYDENTWALKEEGDFLLYRCYEKIDGTCLMFYVLYDDEDNLIEIVPRTRGMAVAGKHILDMYRLVDDAQIKDFYSYPHNYDTVLMFELYGILNRHEISYYDSYINIKLIGATEDKNVLLLKDVLRIAYAYHFETPSLLFELYSYYDDWRIKPLISRLFPYYLDKDFFEDKTFKSLEDCIEHLKQGMEDINQNYEKQRNKIAFEGVVINGSDEDGNQRYIKIKPYSIFERAKLGNGIPSHAIRKEVYKYFDEYGITEVKEIYNRDKFHFILFVQNNLLEEFPEDYVQSTKTVKKINNIFFDIWEQKTPSLTIQNVCQELTEKYPDKNLSETMKIFAKEYPSLKNKSRMVYSVLSYSKEE